MKKPIYIILVVFFIACNKLIELPKNDSFLEYKDVENNENLMESYLISIYDDLYYFFNNQSFNRSPYTNLSIIIGAISDEFDANVAISNNTLRTAYENTYNSNEIANPNFFTSTYKLIIRCNVMLDKLNKSVAVDRQFLYEIKTIRSILYYYLIQIYEEIPLIVNVDIEENLLISRTNKNVIYDYFINELENVYLEIDDLNKYYTNNSINYNFTERVNKSIVAFYLSSFYLLKGNYDKSILYSNFLKEKFEFEENNVNKFKLQSHENIWVLRPSAYEGYWGVVFNNANASFLNYKLWPAVNPFSAALRPFSISDSLINTMLINDKRKINNIDSVYFNSKWRYISQKYKFIGNYDISSSDEQFVIIRLPIVYFNLIEAHLQAGNMDSSLHYLNEINSINYLNYTEVISIDIHDVVLERHKEFFGELGDRWFTLKRTGLVDSVMSIYVPVKTNGNQYWDRSKMLYLPIPFNESVLNPNL